MKITHDIKTGLWCGPAAISAVTGRPTSEIMALARHITRKQVVKGMSVGTLKGIFTCLGYRWEDVYSFADECLRNWQCQTPPTLAKWTRENAATFSKLSCVMLVANHYVTVKGRTLIDNHVPNGAPLKKAPWRRARVARVLRVEKVEGPVFVPPVPVKVEPTGPEFRRKTMTLARKHGVDVSCENGLDVIWVYPPPSLTSEDDDCHAGDHAAYDWREALSRVEDYVRDLRKQPTKSTP